MSRFSKTRRGFMIAGASLAGGFAVGAWWLYRERNMLRIPELLSEQRGEGQSVLNAWLKINNQGEIVVQVPRQEMGQGISTALPMLVAEELDADFDLVHFEQAPIDSVYANAAMFGEGVLFRPDDQSWLAEFARHTQFRIGRALGVQATGGSSSVNDAWEPMRRAGASARAMLLEAAAQLWSVPVERLVVAESVISDPDTGKQLSFAELAEVASTLDIPADVRLKTPEQFRILGTSKARLDVPEKTDGRAVFGIDTRVPDMVYAAIKHCPVFGGTIQSVDPTNAKKMPGVLGVLELPASSACAAAVVAVAQHYWQAKTALESVQVQWEEGEHAELDSAALRQRYETAMKTEDGRVYNDSGDVDTALKSADTKLQAQYFAPYLAHATMEPMNCTCVARSDGTAEVWVGNQSPTIVQLVVARALDIDRAAVTVHTPYLGGGFGRRIEPDVMLQAALIAKTTPDTPVQLIWSREEDVQHDMYRTMTVTGMRAGLDVDGRLLGLDAKLVGQSPIGMLTDRILPGMASDLMKDRTTAEGMFDIPYAVKNRRISQVLMHTPVPVGWWRSVGYSQNAWIAECFIDECAEAARVDPVDYRLRELAEKPRHQRVLQSAADNANWGRPLPDNEGLGVALVESFGSIVAQVAHVLIVDNAVRVKKIWCVIDCGFAVNPDTVVAQMQSGIVFGLTAALHGEITIDKGRVKQSNFPNYRMLSLADTPDIEVEILQSGLEHLGGIGEPGTPPIAPAVCNAIFAATGERIRELPIRLESRGHST